MRLKHCNEKRNQENSLLSGAPAQILVYLIIITFADQDYSERAFLDIVDYPVLTDVITQDKDIP